MSVRNATRLQPRSPTGHSAAQPPATLEQLEPRLLLSGVMSFAELVESATVCSVQTPADVELTGSLETPREGQMYRFEAQATSTLTVDLAAGDEYLDPSLKLYELHNGRLRGRRSNNNAYRGTLDSQLTYNLQCGGVYYVQATGNRSTVGQYDLRIQTTLIDEAGDSFAEAMALGLNRGGNKEYKAIIDHASDVDYYQIVATKTGVLSIQQQPVNRRDTFNCQLYAYDGAENLIVSDTDADGANEVRFEVVAGQTYYVQVAHPDGGYGKYKLKLKTHAPDEAGDTFDEALVVYLNNRGHKTFRGAADPKGDLDYYQFTATRTGVMSVELRRCGRRYPASFHLWAYDADRQLIVADENGYDDQINEVRFEVVAGQVYYVKTAQPAQEIGKYTLNFRTNLPDEAGDTFETALGVQLDGRGWRSTSGSVDLVGDLDYFTFAATQTGLMTLQQRASAGRRDGGNFALSVYDADQTLLTSVTDTDADGVNTASFEVIAGNSYYAKVTRTDRKAGKHRLNFKTKKGPVHVSPTLSGLPDRSLPEDGYLDNTIDLWAFASDPDTSDSALVFSLTGVTNSAVGVSIDSGRYIDIRPTADFFGVSDVTIRVSDGSRTASDTFRITVSPVNDAPTLTALSLINGTAEDTPYTITYDMLLDRADEHDTEGATILFVITDVVSGTLAKGGSAVTPGSTVLWPGESLLWTPAADANGTIDAFAVKAWDGELASATAIDAAVLVAPVNDAPTLSATQTLTGAVAGQDYTITHAALAAAADENDVDGDSISFRVESVASGILSKNGSPVAAGSTLLGVGESLVWRPAADASGTVNAFSVTAWDGAAESSSPVMAGIDVSQPSGSLTLNPIGHKTVKPGETLTFLVTASGQGALTYSASNLPAGAIFDAETLRFSWTPTADQQGPFAGVRFSVTDGSSTAYEDITITPNLVALGKGATNALYIDNDADGYGPAAPLGPDADDSDPAVNTAASMLGEYGTLEAFLSEARGYSVGRILYVATGGNDATAQVGDASRPYATFNGAKAKAQAGDAIVYRAGSYVGGYGIANSTLSGTAANPIVIMAYPGELVNLDATSASIALNPVHHLIIDGFTLNNTQSTMGYGIDLKFSSNITFRNLHETGHYMGMFAMCDLHDIVVEDSVFHDNTWSHGLYFGSNHWASGPNTNITVRGCLIYNNSWTGVQHNGRVTNMVIDGNIIHSNNLAGISFEQGVSHSTVRNNLIFNNNRQGIVVFNYDSTDSGIISYDQTDNLFVNNTIWIGRYGANNRTLSSPSYMAAVHFNDATAAGGHSFDNNVFRNNIFHTDNGPTFEFLQRDFLDTTVIENNVVYRTGGDGGVLAYGGTLNGLSTDVYDFAGMEATSTLIRNNAYADPGFEDASIDYHNDPQRFCFDLIAASPAIDFATQTDAPQDDLRDGARGAAPDAGCYEHSD